MKLFDVYPLYNITPTSGKGAYIYDENELKYLDLYGGHAVISVGHSHPTYVQKLQDQLGKISFYSNAVQNPLQVALADKLKEFSPCKEHQLFLCNSGAEANENALKLASFHNGKKTVLAFKNGFHGRTSAAVAATDNPKITAPLNQQQEVVFCEFGNLTEVEEAFNQHAICAVIFETIQGVGGLEEATSDFYQRLASLCKEHNSILIADEVQSGFGRTGDFFAFEKHCITPDIITIAKGMGNGFPVGGVLISPEIKASYGLLGTTFGGNHLACTASLAVLEIMASENLLTQVQKMSDYLIAQVQTIPQVKHIKGRGLMLGLEFDFPISKLRKQLIEHQQVFTGSSKNPHLLRILPPYCIGHEEIDLFIQKLKSELKNL